MLNQHHRATSIAILCLLSWLLAGCDAAEQPNNASATEATQQEQAQPVVDYLGKPPPMTSETQILSGGWLVRGDGSEPMFDTLVVITNGKIVGIGKRGSLDVPNDSVGVDASGKWILPGPLKNLNQALNRRDHDSPLNFTNDSFRAISPNRPADLVLFNGNPLRAPEALADIHAQVINGDIVPTASAN